VFAEDVTEAAEAWGLIAPHDSRAWGAIYTRALRADVIAKDKTLLPRERKNGSLAAVYRSLIFKGAA
jgi:hypothetical protein